MTSPNDNAPSQSADPKVELIAAAIRAMTSPPPSAWTAAFQTMSRYPLVGPFPNPAIYEFGELRAQVYNNWLDVAEAWIAMLRPAKVEKPNYFKSFI